jgi:hypothetical protein
MQNATSDIAVTTRDKVDAAMKNSLGPEPGDIF